MKAAAFKGLNELEIVDAPRPKAAHGEVVLKVHDCGICGSDLHAAQHGFGMAPGAIMGHEFSGKVAEISPEVRDFKPGDRVTALPYTACGVCDRCQQGLDIHCRNIRPLGLGQFPGAYAEYVACGVSSLYRLPDDVSWRDGALVEPLSVDCTRSIPRDSVATRPRLSWVRVRSALQR
jgi:threonine dehydrogenase-like Zn-dependent dehydrogenase